MTPEQPCFRMKPGARDVIRHSNVCAELAKQVKGGTLSRSRVSRGQHPQRPTSEAVAPQCLFEAPQTAPTDKSHDDVNCVSRIDLRDQLPTNVWLATGIREQGRVQERNKGRGRLSDRPIRLPRTDGSKDLLACGNIYNSRSQARVLHEQQAQPARER